MTKKTSAPYTPMMMQFLHIKSQYPDTLIFFRLGDFYELFFEDAKIASRELSLVLTGKSAGQEERVPMCGIPFHAYKSYLKKLIDKGYKVAMVEQMEDPATTKGLVQREVTQIYTPGSFVDDQATAHNFLLAISEDTIRYWLVYGDVSTGEVYRDFVEKQTSSLIGYCQKLGVHEVVMNAVLASKLSPFFSPLNIAISVQDDVGLPSQDGLGDLTYQRWLTYVKSTQKKPLTFFRPLVDIDTSQGMQLDAISLANLEVLQSLRNQAVHGSLYWLLDQTVTSMGSRLLKQWLMRPSTHLPTIRMRHALVGELLQQFLTLTSLQSTLKAVYDLPRLIARLNLLQVNARDLLSLKQSLQQIPALQSLLATLTSPLAIDINGRLKTFPELVKLIEDAIQEEPPVSIKEGDMIKPGYDANLDHWLALAKGGKQALLALESKERERTGIKNLKVGYHQVFGYYLEVTAGQLSSVKPEFGYERRQTLANAERFINPELKALESQLLQAEETQKQLEEKIFFTIVETIRPATSELQTLADTLAELDVLLGFAQVSSHYQYVMPTFHDQPVIHIVGSRHPVIEKVMKQNTFVANDLHMDETTNTLLITGPNMGGKSTYMRQIALLMIMAQIGCYVPATSADLMWVDAIYTRIGASDDLLGGQSTFMMEMSQTEFALSHATNRSLLIFDEIGRGTATFDGMALAQAIMEYTTHTLQAKTLFSTHYHELTQLASAIPTLKNIHVAVHEENDTVTFLYQVKPGSMSQSFGIHVAQLANLPSPLIARAKAILSTLEKQPIQHAKPTPMTDHPLVTALKAIDPLKLSPLEALQVLLDLKKKQG